MSAPSRSSRPAQAGDDNGEDQGPGYEAPAPVPVWDEAARSSARQEAIGAMNRFARPGLSAAVWWKELRPLLSTAAATAFEGTDPASVPVHRVTGRASVRSAGSAYLAEVVVPTDAGRYSVLLVRTGAGEGWLVEDIRPPRRVSR